MYSHDYYYSGTDNFHDYQYNNDNLVPRIFWPLHEL
jgi:hypothetical protein